MVDNGQEEYRSYYINNQAHNENGPACQCWYENGQEEYRSYYINDQFHNENGPACQGWDDNGKKSYKRYYINDQHMIRRRILEQSKSESYM